MHAIPHRDEDRPRISEFARFGEPLATTRDVAVRLRDGLGLTDIVRAVDQNGVDIADLELRAPTLDDVFLAKTGRTSRATEEAERSSRRRIGGEEPAPGRGDRASLDRPDVAPAGERHSAARLPGRAHGRERRRRSSTDLPGFPTTSFLAFALAVPFIQGALFSTMNAGTDLRATCRRGSSTASR